MKEASEELLFGRRALEVLPYYQMIDDLNWHETIQKWSIHFRLEVKPSPLIPQYSRWYIVVDDSYPYGDIKIYPSKDEGISNTHNHQLYNGFCYNDLPWRSGEICEHTSLRTFRRREYDYEEPNDAEERLLWHIKRAEEWLEAASTGTLVVPGDRFELPHYPSSKMGPNEVGYFENTESLSYWEGCKYRSGYARLSHVRHANSYLVVVKYLNKNDQLIKENYINDITIERDLYETGIWMLIDDIPRLDPWQAPTSYRELRLWLKSQQISFDFILRSLVRKLRDGRRHICLLGFPIPEIIGGVNIIVHWQSFILPCLSFGKINGFTSRESSYQLRDRNYILNDSQSVDWVRTNNWHSSHVTSRGRIDYQVAMEKYFIIGAGALGSSIAELLVRTGVDNISICDPDNIEIGNLCRHTLDSTDLGKNKAIRVAKRLSRIRPQINAKGIPKRFQDINDADYQDYIKCNVVIDCTGDDALLKALADHERSENTLYLSVSIGMKAKRMFIYIAYKKRFPLHSFVEALTPWILKERGEFGYIDLPREGIGCWHPLFPARADDINILSSCAISQIEEAIRDKSMISAQLRVFERTEIDGRFIGIRRV